MNSSKSGCDTDQHSQNKSQTSNEIAELEPFARELVRLARDVTQEINRGRLTPRCLSGLTAMNPIIGLIQGAALKILGATPAAVTEDLMGESESRPSAETQGNTPGYL